MSSQRVTDNMNPTDMRDGLLKALEASGEGLTLQYVEEQLSTGEALLWTGKQACLVTSLHTDLTTSERFLHVWLGCGDIKELIRLEPGISAWARARQCTYASIDGRKGWQRVFKRFGFNPVDGELRKYYV